ncbi:glycosyltransferase family 25 protein [Helicobacter salomonis]|uniref:glycosyltransferase family 25 protein n=1 Tax=Helicobacter salomonis TaxID=56878 RepID=UPI000CF0F275|nr:glycosyltransferase family 25 protein [Helicobacter salomonis]
MNLPIPIYIIHLSQSARDITPLLWHLRYLLEQSRTPDAFEITLFEGVNGREDFAKQGITFKHAHPVLNDFAPETPKRCEVVALMRLALCMRVNFQSLGQLGCFASHFLLWQECIKLQKPIIVLEDDVLPTFDFYEKCLLGLESLYANKAQMVRLAATYMKRHRLRMSVDSDFDCLFSPAGGMGTQGYMLSPQGAQKLLEHCPPQWILPVDTYMDAYYVHEIQTLTFKSQAVFGNSETSLATPANIQRFTGKLKALSWLLRLCNYTLKIRWFCQHLFNLLFRRF